MIHKTERERQSERERENYLETVLVILNISRSDVVDMKS